MLKVILPLAGSSDIFINNGYSYPKPLIDICGRPMIDWVLDKVSQINRDFELICIVRYEDCQKYHLDNIIKLLFPKVKIVFLRNNTAGALCSVLMAVDYISDQDELLILNGDQIIDYNLNKISEFWDKKNTDAGVVTFRSVHPRWSYILFDEGDSNVYQTAEKNPISNLAIAGYYYFRNAKDFMNASYCVLMNEVVTDDAYYISSVINELILCDKKAHYYLIESNLYHSFYSPQRINEFEYKYRNYEKGKA